MNRNLQAVLAFLILIFAFFLSFFGRMPQFISEDVPEEQFSTIRAFQHVKNIAQQPHFVGSPAHNVVKNYIVSELQQMGLLVQTQQDYALNEAGVLTAPQNIISRIEGSGSGKALLLLTHYDSAVHSSPGASDAASGVATILEGIRAFLASGTTPENDIIIVFTDAEELGLNGAELFVEEHPWAEDVGLALNFEARGSGGPSFMLLETNEGNKKLIKHFIEANPEFPVTNSLAYSVYKMLPNDTDLTVLREKGNIPGFNFAFIDDHFDYHTANDTPKNLDKNTLAHQGSYLMPLLQYFSDVPLENLGSDEDLIYFNLPVIDMLSYPFSWIFPLLILACVLFFGILIFGIWGEKLKIKSIFFGFIPLLLSLFSAGFFTFWLWELALWVYPQYLEMEHGFTYNGYFYIAAAILLSLSLCFFIYAKFRKRNRKTEYFIAPVFLWLLISDGAAFYLKGAAYFIIPVLFALAQLGILLKYKKPNLILLALLSLPALFILQPFLISFPVALGLKMLFLSAVLGVLLWVLFWPLFAYFRRLNFFGLLFFFGFLFCIIFAHFKSDFNVERPKSNSLVYILDADQNSASWNTYDLILDEWTQPFFENEAKDEAQNIILESKYDSRFTRSSSAPVIDIKPPTILMEKETDSAGNTAVEMKIAFNREINRLDVYTEDIFNFSEFTVNGEKADPIQVEFGTLHVFKNRTSERLLTYFAANQDTLRLNFKYSHKNDPEFIFFGANYSLFDQEDLNVPPRPAGMLPRPFVLNDAVIIKKKIDLN